MAAGAMPIVNSKDRNGRISCPHQEMKGSTLGRCDGRMQMSAKRDDKLSEKLPKFIREINES